MNGNMAEEAEGKPGANATATAYEWLRLFGDAPSAETEKDLIRHLECVDMPESQRESVRALERKHFAQFLRLRRDQRLGSVERVSERRMQMRARGREKWRGVEPDDTMAVEDIQQRFPQLYQKPVHTSGASKQKPPVSRPPQTTAPTPSSLGTSRPPPAPSMGSSSMDNSSRTMRGSVNPAPVPPHVQPPPPQRNVVTPPVPPSMTAPHRALSDLLKKKSSESYDDDGDEPMPYPYRPQREPPPPRQDMNGRNPFQTAGDKLHKDRVLGKNTMDDYDDDGYDRMKRNGRGLSRQTPRSGTYHPVNPHLLLGGGNRSGGDDYDDDDNDAIRKKFVSPVVKVGEDRKAGGRPGGQQAKPSNATVPEDDEDIDPRLRSCDPELISKIEMEIVDNGDPITFDDIAGLQFAKKCVNELVIWPMARPDIFTGLRALPKGLLLFGPPGTGKTLIGKAIANQSGATFFSISASSLTSKWIGEGEKLVRTLFAVAAVKQPSVIFIDEIDSLLTQRSSEENEASRRMKTEFLVQLDGAGTKAKDVILVVGATNRPQELDEAARRRFVKRLYIPLPSSEARLDLVNRLLKDNRHGLSKEDLDYVAEKTAGYSGADVRALCTEAAMGPIRTCLDIRTMDANSVRPINLEDFNAALRGVRSSVAAKDLEFYRQWNDEFGSFAFEGHEG